MSRWLKIFFFLLVALLVLAPADLFAQEPKTIIKKTEVQGSTRAIQVPKHELHGAMNIEALKVWLEDFYSFDITEIKRTSGPDGVIKFRIKSRRTGKWMNGEGKFTENPAGADPEAQPGSWSVTVVIPDEAKEERIEVEEPKPETRREVKMYLGIRNLRAVNPGARMIPQGNIYYDFLFINNVPGERNQDREYINRVRMSFHPSITTWRIGDNMEISVGLSGLMLKRWGELENNPPVNYHWWEDGIALGPRFEFRYADQVRALSFATSIEYGLYSRDEEFDDSEPPENREPDFWQRQENTLFFWGKLHYVRQPFWQYKPLYLNLGRSFSVEFQGQHTFTYDTNASKIWGGTKWENWTAQNNYVEFLIQAQLMEFELEEYGRIDLYVRGGVGYSDLSNGEYWVYGMGCSYNVALHQSKTSLWILHAEVNPQYHEHDKLLARAIWTRLVLALTVTWGGVANPKSQEEESKTAMLSLLNL